MLEKLANTIPVWMGSTTSIVLHTLFFVVVFMLLLFGVSLDTLLLVLTTAVSLEAIYLSLFIQRSVNLNTATLEEAAEDIQGIEEDIEEISEDVEGIEKDIDEISEDVGDLGDDLEGLEKDLDAIGEDIDEVSKDIEGLEGDMDELQEQEGQNDAQQMSQLEKDVAEMKKLLQKLTEDLALSRRKTK